MILTSEILHQMTQAVVKTVSPIKIILFGSQATGNAKSGSDIDLLVIVKDKKNRLKESAKIWRALASFQIAKDILLYSMTDLQQWAKSKNHVIARALKEGKVLYERN